VDSQGGGRIMFLIEGSPDGVNWYPYGKALGIYDARDIASKCIKVTNHTHVRITEASQ